MIISWLTGGLGNQMFQYAAGLALAHRRRTVLKLDVSWFREYSEYEQHNRYALECLNVTEQFATREEIERTRGLVLTKAEKLSARWARQLHLFQYANRLEGHGTHHRARSFEFYPEFWGLPDETYLEGMWQSEKFFAPVAELLRLHFSFRYPAAPAVAETLGSIRAAPSAAVHFRRGDYIRNEQFAKNNGALDFDYYHRALELLLQREPKVKLFVFSDDIDAVEREFHPPCEAHFVRSTSTWNSFEKIRMMSACDHAIIANSTFSWWAAWLGEKPGKYIFAPHRWFAQGSNHSCIDLVPERWERV